MLKSGNFWPRHCHTKWTLENKQLNQNCWSWYHFSQEKLLHTLITVIASTYCGKYAVPFFLGHPVLNDKNLSSVSIIMNVTPAPNLFCVIQAKVYILIKYEEKYRCENKQRIYCFAIIHKSYDSSLWKAYFQMMDGVLHISPWIIDTGVQTPHVLLI